MSGPHLLIVPKSPMQNWLNEFKKWCPSLHATTLIGNGDERNALIENMQKRTDWDVLITSYEMCLLENKFLNKYQWNFLIIDEAHRLKNQKAQLNELLQNLNSDRRLLITGTPIQNIILELHSLENFLNPTMFPSSTRFVQKSVKELHSELGQIMLRRTKAECQTLPAKIIETVYIPLTEVQQEMYNRISADQLNR